MEMVGWEKTPIVMQILHSGLDRLLARPHMCACRHQAAFAQIARRTRGDHIFPRRLAAMATRGDVIKRQIMR